MMRRIWGWLAVVLMTLGGFAPGAQASVVMQGTRVIVVAGMAEKSIQFSNTSGHPFLVQAWVSRSPGEQDDTDLPFILTPPIFKLDAHTGQTVRMRILPVHPPTDTEQVYYLNFSQIPALKPEAEEANRLVVLVKSTVKIFYRPKAYKDGIGNLGQKLRYRLHEGVFEVENPTSLHASISSIRLKQGDKTLALVTSAQMISPGSSHRWSVDPSLRATDDASVLISTINDYGAETLATVPLGLEKPRDEAAAQHHEP